MKKTRSEVQGNLYDPVTNLQHIETKLLWLCKLAGIDNEDLDSVTIDDIVGGIRANFYYTSATGDSVSHSAIDWLRTSNSHLVAMSRKYWWYRQIANGVASRG
jgi:5-formaminoimidazole-4-carboxamide-1-beta-D-ribofuranosyl 5'-monophosphate synthetase